MGNYTQNTVSGNTIQKQIVKIEISTVTGGATEVITLDAHSMLAPILQKIAITTPNAHSEVGQQVGITLMLDFIAIGTGDVTDWTSFNELKDSDNIAAYLKVTFVGGQTEVFDSGATGGAIIYINGTQSNDGDGVLEYRFHAERIISNIDSTVS